MSDEVIFSESVLLFAGPRLQCSRCGLRVAAQERTPCCAAPTRPLQAPANAQRRTDRARQPSLYWFACFFAGVLGALPLARYAARIDTHNRVPTALVAVLGAAGGFFAALLVFHGALTLLAILARAVPVRRSKRTNDTQTITEDREFLEATLEAEPIAPEDNSVLHGIAGPKHSDEAALRDVWMQELSFRFSDGRRARLREPSFEIVFQSPPNARVLQVPETLQSRYLPPGLVLCWSAEKGNRVRIYGGRLENDAEPQGENSAVLLRSSEQRPLRLVVLSEDSR